MAHIAKAKYTTKIPPQAERLKNNSVRWVGRDGRPVVGVVCEGNGSRCRVESRKYYCHYRDENGVEREKPAFEDAAASEALLSRLVTQSARIASGLLPPEAVKPRESMATLLLRWRDHLAASGTSPLHPSRQYANLSRLVAGIGALHPAALTPGRVNAWLSKQRRTLPRFSAQTAYHYAGAAKAFTRWLAVTEKYEPVDHLSGLVRKLDETDRRHKRRVLNQLDLKRLLEQTAKNAAALHGLSGIERAALYAVACSTGLRASELASLTVQSFDLSSALPLVTVEAAYAKNRRKDELYLPNDLLPQVRKLLKGRKPSSRVWPDRCKVASRPWWKLAARMLRADFASAGIPYRDERGRVYDFHALRSQFITDLDRAGVSLARAQKLARHCTPMLTSKHYSRPERDELAADVNRLKR